MGKDINIHLRAETETQTKHSPLHLAYTSKLSHKEHIKSLNQCVHTISYLPLTCFPVCNCSQQSVGYTINAAWDRAYIRRGAIEKKA